MQQISEKKLFFIRIFLFLRFSEREFVFFAIQKTLNILAVEPDHKETDDRNEKDTQVTVSAIHDHSVENQRVEEGRRNRTQRNVFRHKDHESKRKQQRLFR